MLLICCSSMTIPKPKGGLISENLGGGEKGSPGTGSMHTERLHRWKIAESVRSTFLTDDSIFEGIHFHRHTILQVLCKTA